jgi:hypothetical protein
MTRLIIDAATLARLQNLQDLSEVCDESGRVLGYFHPVLPSEAAARAERRSPFTDEELQQRRQQRTGRPLAEILERLGKV